MNKSGLFYLENYLAPGYVYIPEGGTCFFGETRKLVRPGISEELKSRPACLLQLRGDLPDLMAFLKAVERNEDLSLPLSQPALLNPDRPAAKSDGLTFIECLKTGHLRFERREGNLPCLIAGKAFQGAFRMSEQALASFADCIAAWGSTDERISCRFEGRDDPQPRKAEERSSGEPEETVLGEFRLTYLPPEEQAVGIKEQTVRDNLEWSMQQLSGMLKDSQE